MEYDHLYIQKMLLKILTWNNYNIYYVAKTLNISRLTLLSALSNGSIKSLDRHKIISYYFAHCHIDNKKDIDHHN